jgi:hypothetical protein
MDKDRVVGLNDLPCCELERRSSHHKGIFFEVPLFRGAPMWSPSRPHAHFRKEHPKGTTAL